MIINGSHQVHLAAAGLLVFHQVQLPQLIGLAAYKAAQWLPLLPAGQAPLRQRAPHRLPGHRLIQLFHQPPDLLPRAAGQRQLQVHDQLPDFLADGWPCAPGLGTQRLKPAHLVAADQPLHRAAGHAVPPRRRTDSLLSCRLHHMPACQCCCFSSPIPHFRSSQVRSQTVAFCSYKNGAS